MQLKVKSLNPLAILPSRSTQGSAGYDLSACLTAPVTLYPGKIAKIGTGLAIEIDPECVALVFGRSGLGVNRGILPANGVGVIDSDYRGEIVVGLINHGSEPYTITPGERIAQMVLVPILTPPVVQCEELSHSNRGADGFGSTGTT